MFLWRQTDTQSARNVCKNPLQFPLSTGRFLLRQYRDAINISNTLAKMKTEYKELYRKNRTARQKAKKMNMQVSIDFEQPKASGYLIMVVARKLSCSIIVK